MTTIQQAAQAAPASDCVLLRDVSWEQYEALRDIEANYHVRMTFDREKLELATPSQHHMQTATLIVRLIQTVTEDFQIPLRSRGSTTWKRPDLKRALEADACYYIKRFVAVTGRRTVDLRTDPPPDLAVDVECSRSVIDKLAIYASLGVPEIWFSDGGKIVLLHLRDDGRYQEHEFSWNLPFLRVVDLNRFLTQFDGGDETAWIRSFRAWLRETFGDKESLHGRH